MEDMISSLQAVKNTLESLHILSTNDNMEKLFACQEVLTAVMHKLKEKPEEAENGHGNAE